MPLDGLHQTQIQNLDLEGQLKKRDGTFATDSKKIHGLFLLMDFFLPIIFTDLEFDFGRHTDNN